MSLDALREKIAQQMEKPQEVRQEVHVLASEPMNKVMLAMSQTADNIQWGPQEAMQVAMAIIEGCKRLGVKVTGEITWE